MKVAFVVMMFFFSHAGWSGENMLTVLREALESKAIVNAKLYFLPYGITTIVSVDRNMIVGMAEPYSIVIDDQEREKLIKALKSSSLKVIDESSDLRSAVEFLGEDGKVIFSIYLSGQSFFGDGRYGYVNEIPAKGLSKFQKWVSEKRQRYEPRMRKNNRE